MSKEGKDERFKRVAEKRVQNIIKGIRSLSQLTNKKVYQWDDELLKRIWNAIELELESCKKRFAEPDSDIFKL